MGIGSCDLLDRKTFHHRDHRGTQRTAFGGWGRTQISEDSIYEWGCGFFSGALDEFDAFVECGSLWDSREITKLVDGEAHCDQDLEIEFLERLRGALRDFIVEAGAPAEDSHYQFGGEGVVLAGEILKGARVKKFIGVGRFALDSEQDIEGCGASGGDGHSWCIVRRVLRTMDGASVG